MSRGTAMSISSSGRPVALGHHELELLAADDRVRRGGRAQHDVGLHELLGQLARARRRVPPKRCGEAERAVGVAVGDEDRAGALLGQRAGRQLARLAGAEDHDVAARQRAEHALREVDRDRRHAHAAGADLGLERTRLPVVSAAANRRFDSGPVLPARIAASCARRTWPWISASPTIIDSSPAVTR